MEKVVYLLWSGPDADVLGVVDRLARAGAKGLQVNLADAGAEPAARWRIESHPPAPDAFVSLWLPTAHLSVRGAVDDLVRAAGGRGAQMAAYLVTESCPLANTRFPTPLGQRTPGFAQVALLRRPADQPVEAFLRAWLDEHTAVAIDTQDTFGYVQNLVVRTLVAAGEPCDAIVEELFPEAAMTDPHAFFDAVGDDERLAAHTEAMIASTSRFLDLARLDVVPTSRFAF